MKVASKESFLGLQKFTKFYASGWFLPLVLIVGLVFILLPTTFRENTFMIGDESFYHLRIAQDVLNDGSVSYDSLSFSGRDNFMELGLSYSIAGVSYVSGMAIENSARLLFILLGLASLFIGYLILKHFNAKKGSLILPIVVLSPPFIYLFSVVNQFAIPIFLSLLTSYLFVKRKYYFAILPLILMPFFNYIFTIFILGAILISWVYFKKKKIVLFILLILLFGWIFSLDGANINFISDFGSGLGLSIFGIFVVLFGLGMFWKKRGFAQLYLISFLLLLASIKFPWLIFVLTIPLSLLIALNLSHLMEAKWESRLIKELTVLLLVCGLLFSGVSAAKFLSDEKPEPELFDALSKLPRDAVILSHSSNGYWINYAGMKNVIDPFINIEGYDGRERDLNILYSTRDLSRSKGILDKYGVEYILITPNMRHGLVWEEEEEGFLFLLKYGSEFEQIYYENTEIWQYNRE